MIVLSFGESEVLIDALQQDVPYGPLAPCFLAGGLISDRYERGDGKLGISRERADRCYDALDSLSIAASLPSYGPPAPNWREIVRRCARAEALLIEAERAAA